MYYIINRVQKGMYVIPELVGEKDFHGGGLIVVVSVVEVRI